MLRDCLDVSGVGGPGNVGITPPLVKFEARPRTEIWKIRKNIFNF